MIVIAIFAIAYISFIASMIVFTCAIAVYFVLIGLFKITHWSWK